MMKREVILNSLSESFFTHIKHNNKKAIDQLLKEGLIEKAKSGRKKIYSLRRQYEM